MDDIALFVAATVLFGISAWAICVALMLTYVHSGFAEMIARDWLPIVFLLTLAAGTFWCGAQIIPISITVLP